MTWLPWVLYALAGWYATGILIYVAKVGQPRQPIKGTDAAQVVAIGAILIVALVLAGLRLS